MSEIIDISHDDGTLGGYDSTVTDGGKLSVTAGAALAGTSYGLSVETGDTDDKYGQVSPAGVETTLRYRIYVDPNSLTMTTGALTYYSYLLNNAGTLIIARLQIYYTGSAYRTYINVRNDAGSSVLTDYAVISDAPHYVEVHIVSAANSGSSDGTLEWWVDGSSQGTATGWDNYNLLNDGTVKFRNGSMAASGTLTGTFYIDQFVVNDDGSEIGPYVAPATAKPWFIHFQ
jgi:hypothetical protein